MAFCYTELVDSAAFRSAPTTLALSDTCRQLENAELSDLDLLCVSVKAANHTVAVVGACLTLNDELVTQVICDSRIPNRQKRIYRLLLHWENQTGVRSTWSTLVRCLASLEDETLSEGVKDYMEDKVHCAVIAKCKYMCSIKWCLLALCPDHPKLTSTALAFYLLNAKPVFVLLNQHMSIVTNITKHWIL